jgi:hypothetical protein
MSKMKKIVTKATEVTRPRKVKCLKCKSMVTNIKVHKCSDMSGMMGI